MIGVCVLRQEHPVNTYTYRPTSQDVLDRIETLGGTYTLNELEQVNWLNLKCLPISDDDLQILREMPHIEYLNLRGINKHGGDDFSNAGMKHVARLKKLRHLNLTVNYKLTDQGHQLFSRLPQAGKTGDGLHQNGSGQFADAVENAAARTLVDERPASR